MTKPLPSHARFEFQQTPLWAIGDWDTSVMQMQMQVGRLGNHLIPHELWTADALLHLCVVHLPVLVVDPKRANCYRVVANAEALPLVRMRLDARERIPSLVARRGLAEKDRQLLLGLGHMGISALFRDRVGQVTTMASFWLHLCKLGINPVDPGRQLVGRQIRLAHATLHRS
ncbi:hypothetical protein [Rubrivivax albus]|uniref:Uncharacterized protein n=1 Tax=Rubrivivax albus TaxID=2499835 RepID=A0A437JZ50_9BURK|nr:hypothetical protein [Rubrivivax albus]RVT53333.1 hypothetical protein ENE75_00020 [Rubrivivax albus]